MNINNPFKQIPNVSKFVVRFTGLDNLFAKFGITKNNTPFIDWEKGNNASINRYINHQIIRLNHYKTNSDVYFKICELILRKSLSFYVYGLWAVKPKWHRTLSLYKVHEARKEYEGILKDMFTINVNYWRVYIPKEDGIRPLGVPSLAWRIYLHLWNQFLVIKYSDIISKNQHGFIPGRGTLTAWVEILAEVIEKPDIYEFDLESFFPSLDIKYVSEMLSKHLPIKYVNMFETYHMSPCKLTEEDQIDETAEYLKMHYSYLETILKEKELSGLSQMMLSDFHYQRFAEGLTLRGLPQGCPSSPFLSGLALSEVMNPNDSILYADDGLIFGENLNLDKSFGGLSTIGAKLNKKKSGWVKQNGVWLKPLKFLGLEYDGNLNRYRSLTKKGNSLLFDKWDLMFKFKNRELNERIITHNSLGLKVVRTILKYSQYGYHRPLLGEKIINFLINTEVIRKNTQLASNQKSKGSWEEFIQSHLKGFMLSRLYNGDWNLKDFQQDFSLSFKESSWMWFYKQRPQILSGLVEKTKIDIYNSSSIACKSYLNYLKGNRRWLQSNYVYTKQIDPSSKFRVLKSSSEYHDWITKKFSSFNVKKMLNHVWRMHTRLLSR